MANFYFDIETTGLNPKEHKIVGLAIQELDRSSGKPVGPLRVFREWELSEKEILEKFLEESKITGGYEFAFVPFGYNMPFKSNFLKERLAFHGLVAIDMLQRPFVDLRPFGIIMNKGEFKGSGLDKITGAKIEGAKTPKWYLDKEFGKIVRHLEAKAKAFVQLNSWLYSEMPKFLERFRKEKKE